MNHTVSLLQFEYAWEIQAYLRFASIPFEEQNAEYPSVDLTGELPQLCVDGVFLDKKKMLPYLKQHVVNLDRVFPESIQNEIKVYSYMIKNYANQVYNGYKWTKEKAVSNLLSPIYNTVLSFPYNHVYYRQQQTKFNELLGITLDKEQKERDAMLNQIYRVLNEKLHSSAHSVGENECHFLFGSKPSSLDAIFFGHLARIMEFPAGMQSILLCYPALVNYYEAIMIRFFSVARGEKTSDNAFLKQLGLHISCQPTQHVDAVLPYKGSTPRPCDTIDLSEENRKDIVVEEEKTSLEDRQSFREQLIYYTGIGLAVFALTIMIDLAYFVCLRKRYADCEDRTHDLRIMRPTLFQLSQTRTYM